MVPWQKSKTFPGNKDHVKTLYFGQLCYDGISLQYREACWITYFHFKIKSKILFIPNIKVSVVEYNNSIPKSQGIKQIYNTEISVN